MKVFYKQVQLNPTTETDYTDLVNKPLINGVELEGDLSTEQIKVTWYGTQAEFDALPSHDPYTFYIIDDGTPVGDQDSYLDLADKPSINGQILTGNKLSSDIGMYTKEEVDNMMASLRSIKVAPALPAAPIANTMYYIGPDSEGVYMVYLYDATLQRIDLGPSVQKLYDPGKAIQIDVATNVIDVKFDDDTLKTNTNNELYANINHNTIKGSSTTVPVDEAAIQRLTNTLTTAGATAVPANADLNTGAYANLGKYVCSSYGTASTVVNNPSGNAFSMTVENVLSDDENDSNYLYKLRTLKDNYGIVYIQRVYGTSASPTFSAWRKVMTGTTTASGDRFDVYPYTSSDGLTHNGKLIRLYQTDDATSRAADIGLVGTNTNLTIENTLNSSQTGTIITSGLVNHDTIIGTDTTMPVDEKAVQHFTDTLTTGGATSIPNGADLNDIAYTAVGNYYSDTANNSITNLPRYGAFKMIVSNPIGTHYDKASGTYRYRIRELINYEGYRFIQRVWTGSTGTLDFGP